MPKVSKASASQVELVEGVLEDRSENLDGYTTGFTLDIYARKMSRDATPQHDSTPS